jgi:peptidoglycan/xylan/chitin deacetylase (PgdA/CDA1 family)
MDGMLAAAGVMRRYLQAMRGGTTILMYHRVLPDEQCRDYPLRELAIPLSVFEAQVKWLARFCDVRTVRDAVAKTEPVNGRPVVCVSFDDGYRDNFELAAPVLDQYGLHATFFVTTGHTARRDDEAPRLFWFDCAALHWQRQSAPALAAALEQSGAGKVEWQEIQTLPCWMEHLKSQPPSKIQRVLRLLDGVKKITESTAQFATMTQKQIADLHERGHEIASHTMSHPILTQLDDDELAQELAISRHLIATWTGTAPVGICYPNGNHDDRVIAAAAAAGYAYACTTIPGMNAADASVMRLRRQVVFEKSVTGWNGQHSDRAFSAEISGLHDKLRSASKRAR